MYESGWYRVFYVPGLFQELFLFYGGKQMKKLTGNQVRQLFLEYFASHGHMIEPSASLIPHNDPTLLWINSGVAALKKYFDGSETPKCNRITNAQKSIRTNDIENVGKTARHHTFFEMLGNFSIGDYFKEEAIVFAWNFLTDEKWIGLDKELLYVSIHPQDEVAYRVWTEVCHVDPSRILKTEDNFWEIGEGPGGPNSEIFFDRGLKYDSEELGEKLFFDELENDRYIEVWNVVFSQYDCKPELDRSQYKELPQKNIDTGMGLERLVSIIQEGETNFDTDLFMPIINQTQKFASQPYENEFKIAYRVIADHIRTVSFAIADGAAFSNEGRGYVLRRVLRRAIRYGIQIGIQKPFMYELVNTVVEIMKEFYPNLEQRQELIERLVKVEEETFAATLNNGEKLLQEAMSNSKDKQLAGSVVFKLYDTYGFPKELTIEIAEENGFSVDVAEFEACMEEQRQRARNARVDEQSMSSQSIALMNFTKSSTFLGYEQISNETTVIGCFKDNQEVNEITDEGAVILAQTSFYAESGGQIADSGWIINDSCKARVVNVVKAPNQQHLHFVKVTEGTLRLDNSCVATIDEEKRLKIKANHSSIHLLQSALKEVIGDHVAQAGSYAGDEYSRFDFTHFEKMSEQQLHEIEVKVNQMVMSNNPVITDLMTIEQAKTCGAIALFDEKYGDLVRVVTMGDVSKELCGGTHVRNTQEIGIYKIVSEESIGSGIRRITAKTKMAAYEEFNAYHETLKTISESLKMNGISKVDEKVKQALEENANLRKQLAALNQKVILSQVNELAQEVKEVSGLNVLVRRVDFVEGSQLKGFAENLRDKISDSFVFLVKVEADKIIYVCASSKAAIAKGLKAGDIAKMAAQASGGNGGGRPDIAQAGGKEVNKVDEVLQLVWEKL